MPHTAVIDIESQVIDPKDFTPEEAKQATAEINALWSPAEDAMLAIRTRLYECHRRSAWRALKFDSWADYTATAFPKMTKSTVFRSLFYSSFEEQTPELAGIPANQAALLMDLEPSERVDAVELAKLTSGKERPTARDVKKAVIAVIDAKEEVNAETSTENAGPTRSRSSVPKAKRGPTEAELTKRGLAMQTLKKVLSKTALKAIEDETVELSTADLVAWSELDDPASIEQLVIGSMEMRPSVAWAWLNRLVTSKTNIGELQNRANLANGIFDATVDGALVVVVTTPTLRKSLEAWISKAAK